MSDDILSSTSASTGAGSPEVIGFYDADTGSCQYICICPETRHAALIDVVQTLDPKSFSTGVAPAQWALDRIADRGLQLEWILDTHPHADHLMAGAWLKDQTGAPTGIGEKVREIAELWRRYYNAPHAFPVDPHFDRLFADGDRWRSCCRRVIRWAP